MNFLNISLLQILNLYFILLLTTTVNRKYLTYKGLSFIFITIVAFLLIFCLILWQFFILNYGNEFINFKLNSNNWTNISYEINFKINSLSFLFILLVVVIGLATNIYSLNYFKFEERGSEFILLLNWFIFSMIFLVISNNFFTIIIGWELIGITSFLLINFWKFKITTLACSFKAFAFNKFSDIFLMIGFCSLWSTYKINNVDSLLTLILFNPYKYTNILTFSGLCIIISSSIKSAQIIGHLWLPDSMEAPIPASSLIHSATLVSAGIFLLLKFQIIFYYTSLYGLIFFIGGITAFYGGVVSASQTDLKKLLAYSTISHCGFIFASICLNNFVITITYLYLHGLFKSLTFFCAGSLIKYYNTQDTRQMGSIKSLFMNTIMLIVASINLGGLPFTFGYLYKSLFLQLTFITPLNFLIYGLIISGMCCSLVYVFKLIYYSCFDANKSFKNNIFDFYNKNILNHKYYFLNFTFLKYIAFFIIYIFSIFFFITIKYFILKNYHYYYYSNTVNINNLLFLENILKTKLHLISIFYILFTGVGLYLILQNWRNNYFYKENLYFLICKFIFLNFYVYFVSIYKKINFFLYNNENIYIIFDILYNYFLEFLNYFF